MRAQLPPRYWRKVVAATQGIVLAVAAADVLPRAADPGRARRRARPARRVVRPRRVVAVAPPRDARRARRRGRRGRTPARSRARTRARGVAGALTVLALLVVWVALVAPDQLGPPHARRVPAGPARGPRRRRPGRSSCPPAPGACWPASSDPLLGLLVIVKILDMGFFETFDRPFDPIADGSYTGIGIETLRDSIGRTDANLVVAGAAVLGVAVLVAHDAGGAPPDPGRGRPPPLVAAGASRRSASSGCSAGRSARSSSPARRSPPRAPPAWSSHEVRAVQAGVEDHAVFADEIRHDRFRDTPGRPAADRPARQGRPARVRRELRQGRGPGLLVLAAGRCRARPGARGGCRPPASPPAARFLTSSTFGGISWLAHSTLQSGVWVDSQRRYDQLVKSDRLTLSDGVQAGRLADRRRRAVEQPGLAGGDVVLPLRQALRPAQRRLSRPEVRVRLHARPVRLRWPCSASSSAKPHRRPLFAEVDLVSSHTPWTRIPQLIDWNDVGDGSIFKRMPVDQRDAGRSSSATPQRVRAAYGRRSSTR